MTGTGASIHAQRGKRNDEPGEFGRVRNADKPVSEPDGGEPE